MRRFATVEGGHREGGGTGEGELEPRHPPSRPRDGGAGQADSREREDADQQGQRLADDRQGEHGEDRGGHVPARPRPVEQQHQQQDRHRGADVVRFGEQEAGGVAGLGREHDAGGDQRADPALGPAGPAAGHGGREEDEQRVRDRGADVHHLGPEPGDGLHEHVLRQFGGVERHVRHVPAVQQRVAVHDVPRLHGVGRAVRHHRGGAGDPQVGDEEDGRHRRDRRAPPQGRPEPAAGRRWLAGDRRPAPAR